MTRENRLRRRWAPDLTRSLPAPDDWQRHGKASLADHLGVAFILAVMAFVAWCQRQPW